MEEEKVESKVSTSDFVKVFVMEHPIVTLFIVSAVLGTVERLITGKRPYRQLYIGPAEKYEARKAQGPKVVE